MFGYVVCVCVYVWGGRGGRRKGGMGWSTSAVQLKVSGLVFGYVVCVCVCVCGGGGGRV